MDTQMTTHIKAAVLLALLTALSVSACAPSTPQQAAAATDPPQPTSPTQPDVEFTLKTFAKGGRLGYLGVGGSIDQVENPDLVVPQGAVVRIVLINGDGMPHDLYLPDFDAATSRVSKIGEQTEIVFSVGDAPPGPHVYYCTVPGHRQMGQEGDMQIQDSG
jgi:nitrite reductase (NO-forming)